MKKLLILGASTFLINSTVFAKDSSIANDFDILAAPDNSVQIKLAQNEKHSFQDEADKINSMALKKSFVPKKQVVTKASPKHNAGKIAHPLSTSQANLDGLAEAQKNSEMMQEFYKKVAELKVPETMTKVPPQLQTPEPVTNHPIVSQVVVPQNIQKIASSLQHPIQSSQPVSSKVITSHLTEPKAVVKPTAIKMNPTPAVISHPAVSAQYVKPTTIKASPLPKTVVAKQDVHINLPTYSTKQAPVAIQSVKPSAIEANSDTNMPVNKLNQRVWEEIHTMSDEYSTRPITSTNVETLLEKTDHQIKPMLVTNHKVKNHTQPNRDILKTNQKNPNLLISLEICYLYI